MKRQKQFNPVERGQSFSANISARGIRMLKKTALIPMIISTLLIVPQLFAQASRVDIPLLTAGPNVPSTIGALPQALWTANATVALCAHPTSTYAACVAFPLTTYTDSTGNTTCPTSTPLVQLPGTTCTASTGITANIGAWITAGSTFDYYVVTAYGTFGPYTYSPSSGGAGTFLPLAGGTMTGPLVIGNSASLVAGTLSSLVSTYAPSGGTLIINSAVTVPTNYTLPSNVTLQFQGGSINISSGATLNYNGGLSAGRYQIFTGSGAVSFAGSNYVTEVMPEWWGADPSGTNDSSPAFNLAATAATSIHYPGTGGQVSLGGGQYSLYNTVTTIATGTANNVQFVGPQAGYGWANGTATLIWKGVVGGTMFHFIGGHQSGIKNASLNCGSSGSNAAGNCVWFDSDNGQTVTSKSIATISRNSSNQIVLTMTSDPSWTAGTNVTISGVTGDTTLNGTFPVAYSDGAGTYYFTQYGAASSGSGGTAATFATGDTQPLIDNATVFMAPTSTSGLSVSITSCSITSNVMNCTTSAPPKVTPNMWVWISGSSSAIYNAYWQVTAVTSTGFSATSAGVANDGTGTTNGTVYWGTAVHFGSGQLSLANNSVCCSQVKNSHFASAPYAMAAFAWSSSVGNNIDFKFDANQTVAFRIKALNIPDGAIEFNHEIDNNMADAIYTGGTNAVLTITANEYEGGAGNQFILANLISGSYNSAIQGTNGQFEDLAGLGSPSTVVMNGNSWNGIQYATDGVAIATTAQLHMTGNRFYASGTSTPPYIMVAQYYFGTKQEITSDSNTFANSASWSVTSLSSASPPSTTYTVTAYAPFIRPDFVPVLGATNGGNTTFSSSPVTSIGDMSSNGTGGAIAPLKNATTLHTLLQYDPSVPYNHPASSGLMRCLNNITCWAARNATNTGDDTFTANSSNVGVFGGSFSAIQVPALNIGANLVLPSTLTGNVGAASPVKAVVADTSSNVTLTGYGSFNGVKSTAPGCNGTTPYLEYDGNCSNGTPTGSGTSVNVNGGATLATAALTNTTGLTGITVTNPVGSTVNFNLAATVNGSGAGLTSGPSSSTSGDIATFTGTSGQIADSGTLLTSLAPKASPTFTGKVTTAASASGGAGFNIPQGAAPTSPVNGDLWTTSAGLYAQINGATVGPFGNGTAAFAGLTSGTNTTAAMVVGTGASLAASGSGTIAATTAANLSGTPTVPNGTAATTQSQGDNSTKLATTAYVDTGLGGKAPANLNQQEVNASFSASCGYSYRSYGGAITATLPSVISTGCLIIVTNVGTADVTITAGSVTYQGPPVLHPGQSMNIQTDGSVFNGSYPNILGTLSSGSGTTVTHNFSAGFSATPTPCGLIPTSNSGFAYISSLSASAITVTYTTSGAATFNVCLEGAGAW